MMDYNIIIKLNNNLKIAQDDPDNPMDITDPVSEKNLINLDLNLY